MQLRGVADRRAQPQTACLHKKAWPPGSILPAIEAPPGRLCLHRQVCGRFPFRQLADQNTCRGRADVFEELKRSHGAKLVGPKHPRFETVDDLRQSPLHFKRLRFRGKAAKPRRLMATEFFEFFHGPFTSGERVAVQVGDGLFERDPGQRFCGRKPISQETNRLIGFSREGDQGLVRRGRVRRAMSFQACSSSMAVAAFLPRAADKKIKSQTRPVVSRPTVTRRLPSGVNATAELPVKCPGNWRRTWPEATS
jgi:hypothetical protein